MKQQHKEMVALAQPQNNYVYILKCHDNTYYTGWTTDLLRRLKKHNDGTGAKYTRSRRPVKLVYYEILNSTNFSSLLEKLESNDISWLKKYQKI